MANYVGVHCPVCTKRFTGDDDVVVCPICGAPHHRSCYQELGHCALSDRHIEGHTWEPSEEERQQTAHSEQSAIGGACQSCGANNPPSGIFCQVCGAPLKQTGHTSKQSANGHAPNPYAYGRTGAENTSPVSAFTAAFGGLSPSEEIEGVAARDIAIYIGENSHYFLPRFKQIAERGAFSFNFAAMLFNCLYFFYRKMYATGAIMLAILALAQIPSLFIMPDAIQFVLAHMEDIQLGINVLPLFKLENNLWVIPVMNVLRYVMLFLGIGFAAFANRLYMTHVLKKVRYIKSIYESAHSGFDDQKYTAALAKRGRTSRLTVFFVVAGGFAAYFTIYLSMFLFYVQ